MPPRWELALPQPPPSSPKPSEPELCVRVVATRDVAPGEPLLLCYSSGHSNDAMFLHYGFVPAANMDDDVVLFDDTNAALNWHCQQYVVRVGARVGGACGFPDGIRSGPHGWGAPLCKNAAQHTSVGCINVPRRPFSCYQILMDGTLLSKQAAQQSHCGSRKGPWKVIHGNDMTPFSRIYMAKIYIYI